MSQQSPSALINQARKNLLNIAVLLREGNLEAALNALIFGIFVYVKHANHFTRLEKQDFQDLMVKYVNLVSLDPTIKAVCHEHLEFEPKMEKDLLFKLRALPEKIRALKLQGVAREAKEREQVRLDRIEKGRQLLQQRYYDGALKHFKRLSEDYPQDYEVQSLIGNLLFEINHVECTTFLEKAVCLEPTDHKSLARIGTALRKTRKFDQSEQAYMAALKISENNVNYLFNLARVYIDSTQWQKAQATLRQLLAIDPDLEPAKKALEFASKNCRDML